MKKLLEINPLFFYIIAGIGIFIGVYYLFRNRSLRVKMIFMYLGCAASIVFFLVNKSLHYFVNNKHILLLLPFNLCYVSLFFTPVALRFKHKVFYDFIFYISSLGAVFAIIFPSRAHVEGIFTPITFTYFCYHFLVIVIPFWLFMWKMYSPKISFKGTLKLFGVLFGTALIMHGLNILLIKNGLPDANYFWTMARNGSENVAILAAFAAILPVDFFYLLFCIPILYAYIGIWNLAIYLSERFSGSADKLEQTPSKKL